MSGFMSPLKKTALAVTLAAGAIFATSTAASAYIVCNREGECWHVKHRYAYHPEFGLVIHPDGWRWRRHEHFVWREHDGRGYWRNGVWIAF